MVGSITKKSLEFLDLFDMEREKASCKDDCEDFGINKAFNWHGEVWIRMH